MKYCLAVVAGYAIGWTLCYRLFEGPDYRYYYDYLSLAWTSPGERPTFINIGALAITGITVVGTWLVDRFRQTRKRSGPDSSQ